ncbi:hypothetical protein [Corynebacterium appendicis]|uniref:hypothetical protein n=1 Tax=Corynebacterium appendicis TaxID=163202 RepID=UPI001177840C|nr:hypothetical protein [Corynebacterium appendicis]
MDRYDHYGMAFLVGWLKVTSPSKLSPANIAHFEEETTDFFNLVSTMYLGERSVRWVNRTLLLEEEESCPHMWFQDDRRQIAELVDGSTFHGAWGNNLYENSSGSGQAKIMHPILHAQYIWCFLADVESASISYLALLHSTTAIKSDLLHGVISLHYELAMVSFMRERTRIEDRPDFRAVVDAILESWNFGEVLRGVDRRLERLEHIAGGRSELLQREQSRRMDWILFVLAGTTLISLCLDFIQTAYSETQDGARPEGWIMRFFLETGASSIVMVSALITLLLVFSLLGFSSWSRRTWKGTNDVSRF